MAKIFWKLKIQSLVMEKLILKKMLEIEVNKQEE
jgi:hypothetical protein